MSALETQTFEAERLLPVPDMSGANGAEFCVVRDRRGFHALAQEQSAEWKLLTGWVDPQAALDVALRILGGDPKAMTEPRAMRGVAVALVGVECWLEQARRKAAREGEGGA